MIPSRGLFIVCASVHHGNTRKVAEAIYGALEGEKELMLGSGENSALLVAMPPAVSTWMGPLMASDGT